MKARTVGLIIVGLVALTLVSGGAGFALAQGPNGMLGRFGANNGYGGMMGRSGSSTGYGGMMNGSGPFAGGSMMGGPGAIWGVGANAQGGQPLTLDQAQQAVQTALDQLGNRDLAIDEMMQFQQNFYAIVKEKSTGVKAFEVLVNTQTGAVFPEYGPNMMWNTKYGMMSGQNGGTPPMTVSQDRATQLAGQWLVQNQPGATTETPDTFYGYYTLHTLQDGKVTGMLSVNGSTGQVWPHTWHGGFVQMKDLNG